MMMTTLQWLPFLLLLLPDGCLATEFWNIDCGNSEGFNSTLNITWLGDGDFVRSGQSYKTEVGKFSNTTYATLRAFSQNKKNCYTIPVGKGKKIEVKATFYYGNYDGMEKPPSFALMFDSTYWAKVEFDGQDVALSYSIIYLTESNSSNICLGRMYDDQDPFINQIKLTVLEKTMYSLVNSSQVLYRPQRVALGADSLIRYPDDNYDRFWSPLDNSTLTVSRYVTLNSNASIVNASSLRDDPPAKLFRTAIAPAQGSGNLTIRTSFLGSEPRPIYLSLYLSEISNLSGSTQKRLFFICKDGEIISNRSNPIQLVFGETLELSGLLSASGSTIFSLVPANGSDLPPVISGLEFLLVFNDFARRLTYSTDVDALSGLQDQFKVLENWTGDPCLPSNYNWEWVNCSSDESPRITSLSLAGYGLEGFLPNFSELDALETIDLHNNSLTGSIPQFLASLPNLRSLNLAYNNFKDIPASLQTKKTLLLNITGNPMLEQAAPPAASPESGPPQTENKNTGNMVSCFSPNVWLSILVAFAFM